MVVSDQQPGRPNGLKQDLTSSLLSLYHANTVSKKRHELFWLTEPSPDIHLSSHGPFVCWLLHQTPPEGTRPQWQLQPFLFC